MSRLGRVLASGGLIAGGLAILSLFAKAFGILKEFKDAFELYAHYLRTPIARSFGIEVVPFAVYALDVIVLWLSLFFAINAFVQRYDGLFVWGHIGRGYCYREQQSFMAQAACILPKFAFALLATPVVCIVATWASIVKGQDSITLAYMTVEPLMVARYLAAFFGLPVMILAGLSLLGLN